jgi:hypothetical protein
VSADLELVPLRPLTVCVIDDPDREPEDAALDRGERVASDAGWEANVRL